MGGLTVARMAVPHELASQEVARKDKIANKQKIANKDKIENPEALVATIRPKGKWPLLLAVPKQTLPTEEARRVLPANYSRADAVTNVQNSMLLLAAFTQGRPDLLSAALEDRIHQPYRSALCPLLPCLQELKGNGILGAALSGAGPSVLIFLDPRTSLEKPVASSPTNSSKIDSPPN